MRCSITVFGFCQIFLSTSSILENLPQFALSFLSKYKRLYYYIYFLWDIVQSKICAHDFLKKKIKTTLFSKNTNNISSKKNL